MTETALPYELYDDPDDDATLIAVKATPQWTRGKARAYITRTREVPFTSGSLSIGWCRLDEGMITGSQPHAPDSAAYWFYSP